MDQTLEHRRSRLRAWVDANGGQAAVVRRYSLSPSQRSFLNQCLGEYVFREKAVAEWERVFRLPKGYLDAREPAKPPGKGVAHALSLNSFKLPASIEWEDLMRGNAPEVFSCSMPDDALPTTTPKGTVLLCRKGVDPVIGDGVIVADKTGTHYVRRYTQGPEGTWLAQADAPGYATLSSRDGIELVAVVFGVLRGKV